MSEDKDSLSLSDALKLSGLAMTGGQAKQLIQSGQVWVNDIIETRRKRKLHAGDEIRVGQERFVLELDDESG